MYNFNSNTLEELLSQLEVFEAKREAGALDEQEQLTLFALYQRIGMLQLEKTERNVSRLLDIVEYQAEKLDDFSKTLEQALTMLQQVCDHLHQLETRVTALENRRNAFGGSDCFYN
jgi:hypothetical protein